MLMRFKTYYREGRNLDIHKIREEGKRGRGMANRGEKKRDGEVREDGRLRRDQDMKRERVEKIFRWEASFRGKEKA